MDNRIIALIVIVIVVAIGAIYVLANPGDNNTTQNDSVNTTNITKTTDNATRIIQNTTNRSDTSTNETPKVNITAAQAQQIAIDASADLGFPAKAHGTPKLFRWTANNRHTWVWDVPLEFETGNIKYGSLYVDAYTGEVIMNE